jgi:glycosyltransferase involved in cell wall biosynthesis
MRIAYVTIHVAPEIMQGGVGKKIKSQTAIWRGHGHEVSIFSLTPAEIPFPEEHQFIFDARVNLLKRELNRAAALKCMLASIQQYKPDIIYLRYGLYSYPLHHIFRIAPVVLETNSNDKVEYASRGKFFYWMNRFTRNLTFASVSGIIPPTRELTNAFPSRYKKPFIIVSNGIDISNAELLPPTKNTTPIITMVASPAMDWHGVDKLICFAEKCPDVTVNIVGYSAADFDMPTPANAHLLGFMDRAQLREIYLTTDVACGTLALHRKNMDEACTLKVREALSFGVPLILAYHDTDLSEVKLDTILQIPNNENNVIENYERIRKFAYDMMGRRVDVEKIYPYFDQQKKEQSRLAFFKKILDDNIKS